MSKSQSPSGEGQPSGRSTSGESNYWLDTPRAHNLLAGGLAGLCLLLLGVDVLYEQHGHFDYETWTGFHAVFGFFAYVGIVYTAKILREFVKRDEGYYGE